MCVAIMAEDGATMEWISSLDDYTPTVSEHILFGRGTVLKDCEETSCGVH